MRAFRVLMFAVLFFLCICCAAQTPLPDTAAAHQFSAWLEAFNRGDRDALLAFLQKNQPARARNIDQDMNFRHSTGGFDLKKVEDASTPTKFVGLVQERDSDQFGRVTLDVAEAEPHAITG